MKTMEQNAGFVYDLENFYAVSRQLNDGEHKEFLESSYTMVQTNKEGNNEVAEENIRNWARRIFKRWITKGAFTLID